jgi:hypothetical protein
LGSFGGHWPAEHARFHVLGAAITRTAFLQTAGHDRLFLRVDKVQQGPAQHIGRVVSIPPDRVTDKRDPAVGVQAIDNIRRELEDRRVFLFAFPEDLHDPQPGRF